MKRSQVIDTIEEFASIAHEWDALADRSPDSTVYQHSAFLLSWTQSQLFSFELRIVVLWEDGRIVAGAPLMIKREAIAGVQMSLLQFLGTPSIDYAELLAENSAYVPLLCEEVFKLTQQVDTVLFENIRETSQFAPFLRARGYHVAPFVSCYATQQLPESRELLTYAQIVLTNDHRKKVAYYSNRLRKMGELRVAHFTDFKDVANLLPVFFQFHRDRWSRTPTPSMFEKATFRDYYNSLAKMLSAHSLLLFSVVYLDEQPIAAHFGLRWRDTLIWYTPSINVEFSKYSPGIVLVAEVMRELPMLGIRRLDFSRGDESYKLMFASSESTNFVYWRDVSVKGKIVMFLRRKGKDVLGSVPMVRTLFFRFLKKES